MVTHPYGSTRQSLPHPSQQSSRRCDRPESQHRLHGDPQPPRSPHFRAVSTDLRRIWETAAKESAEQIPNGAILTHKTAGQRLARHAESALLSSLEGTARQRL